MNINLTPLGHATVLLEFDDFRVLTDPVLSRKIGVSLGPWVIGTRRVQPPPVKAEDLPPVDVVLLSHAHFDHCDQPTLRKLPSSATAIVQRNNLDLVRRFSNRHEVSWHESLVLEREGTPLLRVTSIPSRHWGARMLFDTWRGWGGFLLEVLSAPSPFFPNQCFSILFAGDTAQTSAYRDLRESRGGCGVDVAMMPIGAYDPWIANHCTPEQAWVMAMDDLGAQLFVPIHYGVFSLSNEPMDEPMIRLQAIAKKAGKSQRVVGTVLGATHSLLS